MTREEFLNALKDKIAKELFAPFGYVVPNNVRVSCGWPSRGGLSRGKRKVGECWSSTASKGGVYEIFVSPYVEDAVMVADTLVHELIHVLVGIDEKHGQGFKKVCRKVGLEGPSHATNASAALREKLGHMCASIGKYEHAALDPQEVERKKQTTRMLKLVCEYCGYTIRTTLKWVNYGLPKCVCEHDFKVADGMIKAEPEDQDAGRH